MSTTDAFSALPAPPLNTNLTGSSLPPIPKGWISQDTSPLAIVGQISNM